MGMMQRTSRWLILAALCVAGSVGGAWAEERPNAEAALEADPRIARSAQLPNGFRYLIQQHESARGGVALVLHVEAGSVHEDDDERGYAHFVEHMAFNGTKHFPPGEAKRYFDSIGMTAGLHLGAWTYFEQTLYQLRLPKASPAALERALLFLSDVAAHVTFAPEEVEKEKGVILEEARQRSSLASQAFEQMLPHVMRGTRMSRRNPIGDLARVRGATPESLAAFYRTWYRPERMTLIAVGDVAAGVLEPLVREAFGPLPKSEGAPQPRFPSEGAPNPPDLAIVTHPDAVYADISIFDVAPRKPLQTVAAGRRELVEFMAMEIVSERLTRIAYAKDSPIGSAGMRSMDAFPGYVVPLCGVRGAADGWERALHTALVALRRMARFGVRDDEVKRVKKQLVAGYEGLDPPDATALAAQRANELRLDRVHRSQRQYTEFAKQVAKTVTGEEIDAAFRELLDLSAPKVLLRLPTGQEDAPVPTVAAATKVVKTALAAPLTENDPNAPAAIEGGLVPKAPSTAGKVEARSRSESLDVTQLELANGVRVFLKRIPDHGTIRVVASLSGGRLEEDDETRGATDLAAYLIRSITLGLESHTAAQVREWLLDRTVSLTADSSPNGLNVDITTSKTGFDSGLELLHLLLTKPRVEPDTFDAMRQASASILWEVQSKPGPLGEYWLDWMMSDGDKRLWLPDWERLQALDAERTQAWLEHLVSKAPLTVGIVGDFEPAEVEAPLLQWIGSLAPRADRTPALRALSKVAGPAGPRRERWEVETATRAAAVMLAWRAPMDMDEPTFGALMHYAAVLNSRLSKTLREDRGLTYVIAASCDPNTYAGMRRVAIRFTADPEKAEEAAGLAKKIAETLAAEGPTPAELSTAVEQFRAYVKMGRSMPEVWRQAFVNLRMRGRTLEDVAARLASWTTADPERLKRIAAATIRDARYFQLIATPKK